MPKHTSLATHRAVTAYLANGGTITQCAPRRAKGASKMQRMFGAAMYGRGAHKAPLGPRVAKWQANNPK